MIIFLIIIPIVKYVFYNLNKFLNLKFTLHYLELVDQILIPPLGLEILKVSLHKLLPCVHELC